MPRVCTICQHDRRREIDKAIVAGQSSRSIARRFRIGRSAVGRHKVHAAVAIKKASKRREERHEDNLLEEMKRIQSKAWDLLSKLERKRDFRGAVRALGETRECIESLGSMLERAVHSGAVAGPHVSPCPHCNPDEYREKMVAAVSFALGTGAGLVPILRRDPNVIDVVAEPGEYAALPADSETEELAVLPEPDPNAPVQ